MFKIVSKGKKWEYNTPQIMAILNATPDSFFAASRVKEIDIAIEKVESFIKNGATLIDIGGQSTRPGAMMVGPQQELENVVPIIEAIHSKFPNILISIDTFNSFVAAGAVKSGAHIVNDISCGYFDENILKVVADSQVGYIGMHLTGDFSSMHLIPERTNVMNDIVDYFIKKKKTFADKGITEWVIDPGFGFGKTIEENFTIVKELDALKCVALPILLGVSRKSSIYKTLKITAEEALNGTTIVNTIGILNGASILRVHDVKEAKQIIELYPYLSK
jgi:dihydropteroate synthase